MARAFYFVKVKFRTSHCRHDRRATLVSVDLQQGFMTMVSSLFKRVEAVALTSGIASANAILTGTYAYKFVDSGNFRALVVSIFAAVITVVCGVLCAEHLRDLKERLRDQPL
jgi:putative Mn2+ efflux pump MntP